MDLCKLGQELSKWNQSKSIKLYAWKTTLNLRCREDVLQAKGMQNTLYMQIGQHEYTRTMGLDYNGYCKMNARQAKQCTFQLHEMMDMTQNAYIVKWAMMMGYPRQAIKTDSPVNI